MKLHASGEDYLETILVLQKKRGMVRSVDVARHMEVSKPSVCHAVATLRDGGFLTIDNGQIAQQGTHEELLKQPGIYQELSTSERMRLDGALLNKIQRMRCGGSIVRIS